MSLQTDARLGSQRPAFQSLPADRRGSEGDEAVSLAASAGLELDDWQAWFLAESLQQRSDGKWAAFECALVAPRQNGKGSVLEARQLFGLFLGGELLQVHTAHEFKTAFEHFLRITALVEGTPELDAKVQRIRRGAGEQAIELRTGERLRFLARSSGSGRGLSGDVVYLDEAFALTPEIMGALLPTMSAMPNPQVWLASSHPRFGQRVLWDLCQRGRRGDESKLLYAEWGNEAGVLPDDREAWLRANPALGLVRADGSGIAEDFVEAEREAMRSFPDEFLRERLGVMIDSDVGGPIPMEAWGACAGVAGVLADKGFASLSVGPDQRSAALGFAAMREDGRLQVEVVRHEPGTAWVVEACRNAQAETGVPVVVDPRSPTAGVLDHLRSGGVELVEASTAEVVAACAALQNDVVHGHLVHLGASGLTDAMRVADVRAVGEAWVFSSRHSSADITPVQAVVLAAMRARRPGEAPAEFFVY